MPDQTPVYELTLLLATDAEQEVRARILADLEAAVQRGGGSVLRKSAWGNRGLAYRIDKHDDAEFHLFELTAPPNLLADISHTLQITDGVLRFRIMKAVSGGRGGTEREPASAVAGPAADSQAG